MDAKQIKQLIIKALRASEGNNMEVRASSVISAFVQEGLEITEMLYHKSGQAEELQNAVDKSE